MSPSDVVRALVSASTQHEGPPTHQSFEDLGPREAIWVKAFAGTEFVVVRITPDNVPAYANAECYFVALVENVEDAKKHCRPEWIQLAEKYQALDALYRTPEVSVSARG